MKIPKTIFSLMIFILLNACDAQDRFLDKKSKNSDVIVSTLRDSQALLDNTLLFNQLYSAIGLVATDNLYVDQTTWQSAYYKGWREAYIFGPRIYGDELPGSYSDWSYPYSRIAYTNVVLETLDKIERHEGNAADYDNIKGAALFFRAWAFYGLLNEFAKPYNSQTAATDPGVPLRLSSDITSNIGRASIQRCYQQIIADLILAEELLPENAAFQTRPSKKAALALLAKVALNIGDYEQALTTANKAIGAGLFLYDFNELDPAGNFPFGSFPNNKEVIIYAENELYGPLNNISSFQVDSTLYSSYHNNDLRKAVFYRTNNGIRFKATYTGITALFGGIAHNELYLIRAEANARLGNAGPALKDLNDLLVTRWKKGTFRQLSGLSASEALGVILNERRKELPYTANIRWEDLRRLNREQPYQTTVRHVLGDQSFTFPPNDPRYAFDIPSIEIRLNNMEQNPR